MNYLSNTVNQIMLYCDAVTESVQLLTVQKPINRPDWWKGKFALFQMPTTWEEGGRHLSKGQLLLPDPCEQAVGKRQSWRGGYIQKENSHL